MKVLFLDIDGVLHPALPQQLDAACSVKLFCWLDFLAALLAPHKDVTVVVHSTWRYSHTQQELGDLLGVLGNRCLSVTPRGQRWDAIQWWLSQNKAFTSYRILDDHPDEFGEPPPEELIVCHPLAGVSAPQVQARLRAWLETT